MLRKSIDRINHNTLQMLKLQYDKKYYDILHNVDSFKMKINLNMEKLKAYDDDFIIY